MSIITLFDAHKANREFTKEDLIRNVDLTRQIQNRLLHFMLLSAKDVDGLWGAKSESAFKRFCQLSELRTTKVDAESLEALIEKNLKTWIYGYRLSADDASQLFLYFKLNGYAIVNTQGALNLCSIRGMNRNGTLNADTRFKYNDRFKIFAFLKAQTGELIPTLKGNWLCTSQPGRYYWDNPLNDDGCAVQVADEQFKSWGVGLHRGYSALTQQGVVKVERGSGRIVDEGEYFGINIHSVNIGQDYSFDSDIGRYSAGCTVFASREEFDREFMPMIYNDVNYRQSKSYKWNYIAITGTKFRSDFPLHV